MYMVDLTKILGFDWDSGNIDKSYRKHGTTYKEAEELFTDQNVLFLDDLKHSQEEERFIAIGYTTQQKLLFSVFVIQQEKIRIISIRIASKKERRLYEKT